MSKFPTRMTRSILAITVMFNQSLFAAADLGTQIDLKNVTITGLDVAKVFALQCADDTYSKFVAWAHQNRYLTKTLSVKDPSASQRGNSFTFSSGVEVNMLAAHKIEIKGYGKKYVGSDFCDLFLQTNNRVKDSAANDSFSFLSRAWADDIVKEDLADYIAKSSIMWSTGIGWVAAAAFEIPPLLLVGAAVGVSIAVWDYYAKRKDVRVKKTFESILNSPFSVTCDDISRMVIQGSGHKIIVDKSNPKAFKVNVLKLKTDNSTRDQISIMDEDTGRTKSREILIQWAKVCNNPRQADDLQGKIAAQQKTTQARLQTLTQNKTAGTKLSPTAK